MEVEVRIADIANFIWIASTWVSTVGGGWVLFTVRILSDSEPESGKSNNFGLAIGTHFGIEGLFLLKGEVDSGGGQVFVSDASGVLVVEGLETGEHSWWDIIRSIELIDLSVFGYLFGRFGNPPFLTGVLRLCLSNGHPTDLFVDEVFISCGCGLVGSLLGLESNLEASLGHESISSDIWNIGLKRDD